ncbi:Low-density receptor-like protein [Melia azedarach]|uniref:Low-density receptor-like protein n=1 Tax=Melia azedarach TaxID=155640 RepID=A0ACC1YFL2_MELAZ|nr:Low-density receptor-like protein [Melia azedarach]
MASSSTARLTFRVLMAVTVILVLFYVGRPLYWKISATVQEIRENKQTVKQGISQIVYEAQKSVGWWHDESDSGYREDHGKRVVASR